MTIAGDHEHEAPEPPAGAAAPPPARRRRAGVSAAAGAYAGFAPRRCSSDGRDLLRALERADGVELDGRRPPRLSLSLFGEACEAHFETDEPLRAMQGFADELERRGWALTERAAAHSWTLAPTAGASRSMSYRTSWIPATRRGFVSLWSFSTP